MRCSWMGSRTGGTSAISALAASMRNLGLDVRAGAPRLSQASSLRMRFCRRCSVTFEIRCRARAETADFVFGVGLFTPRGIEVWGTNTDLDGHECATLAGEATARLACPALRLAPGEYLVDVAVHAKDGAPYDYRRKLLAFTVTGAQGGAGVYFPEHRWSFDGGARFRERA